MAARLRVTRAGGASAADDALRFAAVSFFGEDAFASAAFASFVATADGASFFFVFPSFFPSFALAEGSEGFFFSSPFVFYICIFRKSIRK